MTLNDSVTTEPTPAAIESDTRTPTLCAFCEAEAAVAERHDLPACGDCAEACHHLGGIARVDHHTCYLWECCECDEVVDECPLCGDRMGEYGCCLGAL